MANPEYAARDAANSDALLKRSLAVLADECKQLQNDRDTLAGALRSITIHATVTRESAPDALDSIAYILGLPAIQNAMDA